MCECLKAHLLCVAAARQARVPRSVILAVRGELGAARGLAELPLAGRLAYLAERISISEDAAARSLAAMETLGVLDATGQIARHVPADFFISPATLRKRRQRERERLARAELPTEISTVTADVTTRDGVTAVTPGHDPGAAPVTLLGDGWRRIGKGIQQDGVPAAAVTQRDMSVTSSSPYVNVNKEHKSKEVAQRAESDINGAASEPTGERDLTEKQKIRWRWVRGLLTYAETVLPSPEWAQLIEALPDRLVLNYAQGRCHLPQAPYRTLEALSARRKQRDMPLLSGTAEALAPVSKPNPGAPGSGTLAPVEGDLPELLSA